MGVNSSHFVSEENNHSDAQMHTQSQSQPRILTNNQFSKMDWVVARKAEATARSKLTFHRRLGADVLPDEDLIQQMSQELVYPTHRYWTKQTIHNLFRICLDGSRKMDCRYLTIVLLSNYILRANQHPVGEDMYGKEDLEGFYDSMVDTVTCLFVSEHHSPPSPIQTDIQYKSDTKKDDDGDELEED